jgi:hypothetical protein
LLPQLPLDVVVLTADRPAALARCLSSVVAGQGATERQIRLSVFDNSISLSDETAAVARRFGVRYLGRETIKYWRARLISGGSSPEVVDFALASVPLGIGAARNAILLESAGKPIICLDDDVVCSLVRRAPATASKPKCAGPDPRTFAFPGSGDDVFEPSHSSLFASYRPLGKTVDEYGLSESSVLVRGWRPNRRIRLAMTGLRGNDALVSPSRLLFLKDESRDNLLRTESVYRRAYMEASNTKYVESLSLVEAPVCCAASIGLDNSSILPPFLPSGRGQDMLFGLCASLCDPLMARVYLPEIVLHQPVESRQRPEHAIWSNTRFSTARLAARLLSSCVPSDFAAVDQRIIACGETLERCASESVAAFVEACGATWQEYCVGTIRTCQGFVEKYHGCPTFWREDIDRFATMLASEATDINCAVPVEWTNATTGGKWGALREYVVQFARLLQEWPRMWNIAASNE